MTNEDIFDTQSMDYKYIVDFYENRHPKIDMTLEPEDDPRLTNVQAQLKALRQYMDERLWENKDVCPARQAEIKRLTILLAEGKLYEPKF